MHPMKIAPKKDAISIPQKIGIVAYEQTVKSGTKIVARKYELTFLPDRRLCTLSLGTNAATILPTINAKRNARVK